jgi:hypothetical protein
MKTQTKAVVVGSMTAFVGILSPATVFANTDTGTCYSVIDPAGTAEGSLIVRYITKKVGSLTSNAEENKFGHLKQQVYSVLGKGTLLEQKEKACLQEPCPGEEDRLMTTVDGTIITGDHKNNNNAPDQPGAHMGLDVQFLRFNDTPPDSLDAVLGPITLECSSTESKATPEKWFCNLKAEFQPAEPFTVFGLPLPITLEQVDPLEEPACSVFQDGGGELPIIPNGPPTTPPPG